MAENVFLRAFSAVAKPARESLNGKDCKNGYKDNPMTEQQIPKLTAALVEHQGRFSELSTEDAQWVIQETKGAIALFVAAVKNRTVGVAQAVKKLLAFVTSSNVPALPAFVASDHFKVDMEGAVRIWSLGDNFKAKFLKKTEDATAAADLKIHKLLEQSCDPAIMTELGDACDTALSQFFYLLSKQGKGENGLLLTNGWANVGYIQNMNGVFWAVRTYWGADRGGWDVEAYSTLSPARWLDGTQFLSR